MGKTRLPLIFASLLLSATPTLSHANWLGKCAQGLSWLGNQSIFRITGSAQAKEFIEKFDRNALARLAGVGPYSDTDPRSLRQVARSRIESFVSELDSLLTWKERREIFDHTRNTSLYEQLDSITYLLGLSKDPKKLAKEFVEYRRKTPNPWSVSLNSFLFARSISPKTPALNKPEILELTYWDALMRLSGESMVDSFRFELNFGPHGAPLATGQAISKYTSTLIITLPVQATSQLPPGWSRPPQMSPDEKSALHIHFTNRSPTLPDQDFRELATSLETPLKLLLKRALAQTNPGLQRLEADARILNGTPDESQTFMDLVHRYAGQPAESINESREQRWQKRLRIARLTLNARLRAAQAFQQAAGEALENPIVLMKEREESW